MTISDIAQLAGVSTTTVSRVINNKSKGVGEKTRKRIWEIIEEYGYQPNAVARGLATKSSKIIGVIIPDIANPFYLALADSIEKTAFAKGYKTILCNGGNDPEKEAGYLAFLNEHYVSGIIYNNFKQISPETREILEKSSLPTVFVDSRSDLPNSRNILLDNRQAMHAVVAHLASEGRNRIVFMGGPEDSYSSKERYKGYRDALEEAGLPLDPKLVLAGDYVERRAKMAMDHLLASGVPFDAVACCNDLMALGVYDALEDAGLMIPKDIAVTGFDNTAIGARLRPKLTTVRQPHEAMGEACASVLVAMVEGTAAPAGQNIVYDAELVLRDSVAGKPE